MIYSIMVKMIKKKAKAIVPIGSKPVVRLGASTKRYTKTHWITPLSDTQKFFIATTTDMPHTYKGLPLSKGNTEALEKYKRFSDDFHINAKRQQQLMQKAQNNIVDSVNARLEKAIQVEQNKRLKLIDNDTVEITYKKLQYSKELDEKAKLIQEQRLKELYNRSQAVQKDAIAVAKDQMKTLELQLSENRRQMALKYQELGKQLKFSSGIASLPQAQGFPKYRGEAGSVPATHIFPRLQANKLAQQINKDRKVTVGNGLNAVMKDNKLKRPLDIADAYLNAKSKPDFYIVDSMDNHVALAEATGISPVRLFEMVCNELKGSKKKYEKFELERRGIGIEDLINTYNQKVAFNNNKKQALKYTKKAFYISKERKAWSELYNYDWQDYKRFNDDFNSWIKLFSARATERTESDADMIATWAYENKLGK